MPIAILSTYKGEGATLANYDKVLAALHAHSGGPHPSPDCLFHWVANVGGGFRITNVFTTRDKWNQFAATLAPHIADAGLPDPHKEFIEVERFMTAGSP